MTLYVRKLENQELELLESMSWSSTIPHMLRQRAKVIRFSRVGMKPPAISRQIGLSVEDVRKWIHRFNEHGLLGLFDLPREGRPRTIDETQALRIVEIATTAPSKLGLGFTCWSLSHLQRYLADQEKLVVCRETIRTILDENGISYQKARRWQQSEDPAFVEKKEAITDDYLNPPENTIILCFDQKGPVQFKRRDGYGYAPQGEPPLAPDTYTRHGTGYLLAALNPHTGQVWGRCFRHYNSGTVIWFLGWLLRQLPDQMNIVIIWDNGSPHSKTVKRWLRSRFGDRVQWQHIPVKAAWLNLIEAWMSIFERDLLQNSNFASLQQFSQATAAYLRDYNAQAQPFRWGRKRKKRVFIVKPLKSLILWGRAGLHALSDPFARLLAKAIVTS